MDGTLGERIRGARQRKGWTLKEVAEATGLSVPYLSDLERRPGVNPTLETLTTLASALSCSVGELVDDEATSSGRISTLPPSLLRFVKSEEFRREVARLAQRDNLPQDEIQRRIVDFLAVAPRRSSGELTPNDWRRLLDVYQLITDNK